MAQIQKLKKMAGQVWKKRLLRRQFSHVLTIARELPQ